MVTAEWLQDDYQMTPRFLAYCAIPQTFKAVVKIFSEIAAISLSSDDLEMT